MTLEEAVRAELAEEPGLLRHYRDGDTGVIGWLFGCAMVRMDRTGSKAPALDAGKAEVKRILDQEIAK